MAWDCGVFCGLVLLLSRIWMEVGHLSVSHAFITISLFLFLCVSQCLVPCCPPIGFVVTHSVVLFFSRSSHSSICAHLSPFSARSSMIHLLLSVSSTILDKSPVPSHCHSHRHGSPFPTSTFSIHTYSTTPPIPHMLKYAHRPNDHDHPQPVLSPSSAISHARPFIHSSTNIILEYTLPYCQYLCFVIRHSSISVLGAHSSTRPRLVNFLSIHLTYVYSIYIVYAVYPHSFISVTSLRCNPHSTPGVVQFTARVVRVLPYLVLLFSGQ